MDNITGTAGNDTINAVIDATNTPAASTFTALDSIDGGAGTADTLKINAITDFAVPGGATVTNVENVQIAAAAKVGTFTANGIANLDLSSVFAGVSDLKITSGTQVDIKAPSSANVTVSGVTGGIEVVGGADQSVNMKAAGAAVRLEGGKNVTVNLTNIAGNADAVTVGASSAPSGDVSIKMTGAAYTASTTNTTLSAISVTGGKTITVIQKSTSDSSAAATDTSNATITQGAVTITGNADTTTVTVKQDAAVTAANAVNTTGGVTETASVKFSALNAGDTLVIGGLTFTAATNMSANEAAAAFANLINGTLPVSGDTQGGGPASKGTYTGVLTGWTTSAANGDTVVFTSTTPNTNVTDLANSGTGTVTITKTDGKAHDATPANGKMGIATGAVSVTDANGTIKTITIDGYATGSSTTTTSVLETLNLSNGAGGTTFTLADTAETFTLNAEKLGSSASDAVLTITSAPKTLYVKSTGNNYVALTAALTETLNVSGTGLFKADANDLAALKTVKVTGSAGLSLNAAVADTVTSVDTTGTTGTVTVAIDGTQATYTGGAGVDKITLSTGTALTKAIDLGDGDDTLTFGAAVTGSSAVLSGGGGTDTLAMTVANADALDATVQGFYTNFERLLLTDAAGDNDDSADTVVIDLSKLGFTNYVTTNGTVLDSTTATKSDTLQLDNLASGGTVVIVNAQAGANTKHTINIKDAATNTSDVLNLATTVDGSKNFGTVTAANVETVNLAATDTNTSNGIGTHTLVLTADKATSVNITGNAHLSLTLTGSTEVTSIDASSNYSGNLTVTSLNTTSATTIKGGSGSDILTAATGTTADKLFGGAGDDKLTANAGLTEMTGGAGRDLFVINTASLNVNSYATILDFTKDDVLQLNVSGGVVGFKASKITLGDTAVFQDYANAAMNALDTTTAVGSLAAWFQYGGNTYVVVDVATTDSTTFINGEDFIVKIAGLVDLSQASFNDTYDTIALI